MSYNFLMEAQDLTRKAKDTKLEELYQEYNDVIEEAKNIILDKASQGKNMLRFYTTNFEKSRAVRCYFEQEHFGVSIYKNTDEWVILITW